MAWGFLAWPTGEGMALDGELPLMRPLTQSCFPRQWQEQQQLSVLLYPSGSPSVRWEACCDRKGCGGSGDIEEDR
jgi:hypothetical protein